MKKPILIIGILLLSINLSGTAQPVYTTEKMQVSFFSEARLENIEAISSSASSAAINTNTKDIVFKISIRSFNFKHKLMQEHFNETYMESDKYPYAIFKGKIIDEVDLTTEGTHSLSVEGTIDVHGVQKKRTFTGTISNKGNRLLLDAEFLLPVSDHDIKIPNDKLSNISQTIKVSVHAEFIPKK